MKITGYKLQQRLRELRNELDVLLAQFNNSKTYFPPDPPPALANIGMEIERVEKSIALIQEAQAKYNLETLVPNTDLTLHAAVKLIGPMGRMEKIWRSVAKGKERDRYSYGSDSTERKVDSVYAHNSVTQDAALAYAKQYSRQASIIREGIALANQVEQEMDLDPGLFG